MAAAPPSQASRMILHPELSQHLCQNTSGVFIRTDIAFCCDLMRALCAPGKLLPSTDDYPSCLYYSGRGAMNDQCILNTVIKTAPDPRDPKRFQKQAFIRFDTVSHYLLSLLPIRTELQQLVGDVRKQKFSELRHAIYMAIALDAIDVRGKVRSLEILPRVLTSVYDSLPFCGSSTDLAHRTNECQCLSVCKWRSASCSRAHPRATRSRKASNITIRLTCSASRFGKAPYAPVEPMRGSTARV